MHNPFAVLRGLWPWLVGRRANGLTDITWVPVMCSEGWMVERLLTELHRAGVPAHGTRLRQRWRLAPHCSRWCLWVGYASYRVAEERLAEIIPLLINGTADSR